MTTRKTKADAATDALGADESVAIVADADAIDETQAVAAPRVLVIGRGLDAGALLAEFGEGLEYPAVLTISNDMPLPLVLAQADPVRLISAGESVQHTVNTPAQLHDVIFGMVAVGDRLERDTIGTITKA